MELKRPERSGIHFLLSLETTVVPWRENPLERKSMGNSVQKDRGERDGKKRPFAARFD
jgi:hypothetical protein